MTINETTFLPIWLHYYASQLGYENLYIIDHRSNDTSIWNARKKGALNIIRMEKEELDEEERAIPRTACTTNGYSKIIMQ